MPELHVLPAGNHAAHVLHALPCHGMRCQVMKCRAAAAYDLPCRATLSRVLAELAQGNGRGPCAFEVPAATACVWRRARCDERAQTRG
eukprot:2569745-Lingulodinium_polyedra.AAC.1